MEIRESDRVTRHKTDELTKRKLSTGKSLEENVPSKANGTFFQVQTVDSPA